MIITYYFGNLRCILVSSSILVIMALYNVPASSQESLPPRINVEIDYHYGKSFLTKDVDEHPKGRMGYGIALTYYLKRGHGKWRTALGISYSRIGKSLETLWEDATPEWEMLYGKFPIHYEMWDDVHYISIPFTVQYSLTASSFLASAISLDYPIGTSYYRRRSSDDGAVVEVYREKFNATKTYPWNTSIGLEFKAGKTFSIDDNLQMVIGVKAKVYTLLAARSNDYFPHEDHERPYFLGIILGIQF